VRQREQKAEQEKDLVVQNKLIRIKDQRIPRLQEVTMRPTITGRKCVGTIEAHQNGLRFISSKQETLDVMYGNIKHAIFQPCDKTTMVLVHFHLRDFILVGKKKQKDVQFYTEV
jgi:nucleosome binding factor SPN SPT16 subunit